MNALPLFSQVMQAIGINFCLEEELWERERASENNERELREKEREQINLQLKIYMKATATTTKQRENLETLFVLAYIAHLKSKIKERE